MYTLCCVLPCSVSVSSIVELLGESHHHLLDVWHCCRLFCISVWSPVVLLQLTVWDCSVQNFFGTGIFQNFSMGVLMVHNVWAFPWKLVEPTYFVVIAMVIPHVVSRCENGLSVMAMVVIAFPDLCFFVVHGAFCDWWFSCHPIYGLQNGLYPQLVWWSSAWGGIGHQCWKSHQDCTGQESLHAVCICLNEQACPPAIHKVVQSIACGLLCDHIVCWYFI